MLKLSLIPEWRSAWRMASVVASSLLALLSAIQADVLPLVAPVFSAEHWPYVSGGFALAIIVLRLVFQQGLHPAAPQEPAANETSFAPTKPEARQ